MDQQSFNIKFERSLQITCRDVNYTLVLFLEDGCHRLTTALLITVVSAVVVAIANRPQWHTAIVGLAVKLSVVVTSVCRPHCGQNTTFVKWS